MYYYQYQTQTNSQNQGGNQNQSSNQNQLANLVGTEVKINRGGPESVQGVLLAVQSDFLVVKTKDSVIYISTSHIKSISEVDSSKSNRSGLMTKFVTANNFNALFQKLRHQFVQINRGGPEKIEGFVADSTQDYLLLLVNKELVRVPIYHIRTVNLVSKNSNKNNNNNNNKNNNSSSGNKNTNKSNGNKSNNKSGSKSGNKSNSKSGNKSNNKSGKR